MIIFSCSSVALSAFVRNTQDLICFSFNISICLSIEEDKAENTIVILSEHIAGN